MLLKKLAGICAALTLVLSLTACGSSNLVGTWVEENGDIKSDRVIEIFDDGTYKYHRDGNEGNKYYFGEWTEKENVIAFTATSSKMTSTGEMQDGKLVINYDPGVKDTIGEKTFIKQ